jgi:HEAT repeat protein
MSEYSSAPIGDIDPESGELTEAQRTELRSALSSDNAIDRRHAAQTCKQVFMENAETVRPLAGDLAALADDERSSVAQQAGTVVVGMAEQYPEELADYGSDLVSLAESDVNAVMLLGAQALGDVVVDHPRAAADDIDRIIAVLRDQSAAFEASGVVDITDDEDARQTILEHEEEENSMEIHAQATLSDVLVAVAEAEPSALVDHVTELRALLDHVDATVVAAAVDALAELAAADPEAVAPATEQLVACLDHGDKRVRARSIRALGHIGDDDAVPALRQLAETTDDEAVAELATDTADFLSQ